MKRISKVSLCVLVCVLSNNALGRQLGYDGRDGESGRAGNSGFDSRNEDVVLDGRGVALDMTARDGSDGYDGYDGRDATACGQDRVEDNLYGARGGDGGNGGAGGDGGNVGRLTVRYTDVGQLKNLSIRAYVGRGGYSGRSGRGGRGCDCTYRSWEIERDGKKRTYTCSDGREGSPGSDGARGKDGGVYVPIVIPHNDPIPADLTRVSYWAKDFPKTPVELTLSKWEQRNNLLSLIAAGSRFVNTYYYLTETLRRTFDFKWTAATPMSQYPKAVVTADLASTGTISANVNLNTNATWAGVGYLTDGSTGAQTATVEKVFTTADTQKLVNDGVSGIGRDFVATVHDTGGAHAYIKTRVFLGFFQKVNGRYYRYYQNYLADSLVTRNEAGDVMTINIGKEMSIPETVLKAGNTVFTRLYLERYVGSAYVSRVDFESENVIK